MIEKIKEHQLRLDFGDSSHSEFENADTPKVLAKLYEIPFEEDGLVMEVADTPSHDLDVLLAELHHAKGAYFVELLNEIISHGEFRLVENEKNIYSTGGENNNDYPNLLNAAHKAVEKGYRVYILPNPQGIRTADFIFERKGVYKMFDLKTVTGKSSVDNRLTESVGQTNRVLLHITIDYNPSSLARSIKRYFEYNANACEVLVFKGKKQLSITRRSLDDKDFFKTFIRRYSK